MQNSGGTSLSPKVSLISPCYNGEGYLPRFLDSLLQQDYANVEFIFVDDGSTDRTREVFENYRAGLEAKGWSVEYVWQENQGASGALNNGLKRFTGDYLIWPDSDDILYPNHISRKVEFMEENKEVGIAYCSIDCAKEEDLNTIVNIRNPQVDANMFENVMQNKDWMWAPISPIIRTSAFLNVNPSREIPICRGGQNCQMQLPITYKYAYKVIPETLAKYIIRSSSHSHSQHNFFRRQCDLAEIWLKTIELLPCNRLEKTKFQLRVLARLLRLLAQHVKNTLRPFYKGVLESIFSVKNEGEHKIIRIFRFKIFSIKRKHKA